MTKKELRIIYREKRNNLTDAELEKSNDLLLVQFQAISFPFIVCLLSYWPIEENKEPDTHLLLNSSNSAILNFVRLSRCRF